MSNYISPLDLNYVAVGRAAELIADTDPCLSAMRVLDAFKRALFAGEFDSTHADSGTPGGEWLQIEVVVPRAEMTQGQLALKTRPKQLY